MSAPPSSDDEEEAAEGTDEEAEEDAEVQPEIAGFTPHIPAAAGMCGSSRTSADYKPMR